MEQAAKTKAQKKGDATIASASQFVGHKEDTGTETLDPEEELRQQQLHDELRAQHQEQLRDSAIAETAGKLKEADERFDTVFKILENKVSEVESQEAKPKRSITKKAGGTISQASKFVPAKPEEDADAALQRELERSDRILQSTQVGREMPDPSAEPPPEFCRAPPKDVQLVRTESFLMAQAEAKRMVQQEAEDKRTQDNRDQEAERFEQIFRSQKSHQEAVASKGAAPARAKKTANAWKVVKKAAHIVSAGAVKSSEGREEQRTTSEEEDAKYQQLLRNVTLGGRGPDNFDVEQVISISSKPPVAAVEHLSEQVGPTEVDEELKAQVERQNEEFEQLHANLMALKKDAETRQPREPAATPAGLATLKSHSSLRVMAPVHIPDDDVNALGLQMAAERGPQPPPESDPQAGQAPPVMNHDAVSSSTSEGLGSRNPERILLEMQAAVTDGRVDDTRILASELEFALEAVKRPQEDLIGQNGRQVLREEDKFEYLYRNMQQLNADKWEHATRDRPAPRKRKPDKVQVIFELPKEPDEPKQVVGETIPDGEKPEALWEPPPEDYTPQDEWAPDAREARNLKENKIISWLEGLKDFFKSDSVESDETEEICQETQEPPATDRSILEDLFGSEDTSPEARNALQQAQERSIYLQSRVGQISPRSRAQWIDGGAR